MGNVYTPNAGIVTLGASGFQGRVIAYDDSIVPVSTIPDAAIPTTHMYPQTTTA